MLWECKTFLFCVLSVYITSLVVASDERQQDNHCADLNNITWREYQQQRVRLNVQYLLLTRKNMDCPQAFNETSLTMENSYFNPSRPTKVIIHGYRARGSKPSWVKRLGQALLRSQDVNVVVVDWVRSASFAYNLVVEIYREVAIQISVLINQLQNHGCRLQSFHFIGVSLGAHVAGFVGTLFEGKIGRITGLDPAGPMFKGADTYSRLDPSDAQFVDAIHTDSDYFGISIPVGHVDFFLNGGKDQIGCARSRFDSIFLYFLVYSYVICDHMRALDVYMSALNGSCPLMGIPCSNYEDFLKGRCMDCDIFRGKCPVIGLSENSGISISPIPKEQTLFLLTTSSQPYCAHHILVELEVSKLDKSAEIEVTLTADILETKQILRLQTDTTVYRTVMAHSTPQCEINSIRLTNTGARFYRQAEIHVKSVCVTEFPSLRRKDPVCVNNINIKRGARWSHDLVQLCDF
ncbi:phospholipase A1 member A isoform X1 [Astatotilapia calliptera]|uniref:Phospholipase A1 member A n=1 Tax=Astatotilapia calliptera TaxID=8154 RepID=A0A3P8Q9C0_ASTCA|nr:phospholipase A1 member A isoform X1 [Maylandia zebra]XP_026000400.1 phospholipase A1 member A isoform X1 [Astatotilapia calliptera]